MSTESFTLEQLTNAGIVEVVNGRPYRFSELRCKDYGRLQDRIRKLQPKAVDTLKEVFKDRPASPTDLADAFLKGYERDLYWPASADSTLGLGIIQNDRESRVELVRYLLEKHHPNITAAEAAEVEESMTLRQFSRVAVYGITGKTEEQIMREKLAREEAGLGEQILVTPTGT